MSMKHNNLQVPNPPKAAVRGLGLLNPPRVHRGLNSISPPPVQNRSPARDARGAEESATHRIHVGLLEPGLGDEPSGAEPLILRNVRLKGGFDDPLSDEEKTQVKEIHGRRPADGNGGASPTSPSLRVQARSRFYDFDEDAITKTILVNRIVTVSPNKNDGRPAPMVRVDSVSRETDPHLTAMTDARYRDPMASERPTDLTALGKATQANRRRSVIPVLKDGLKRVFALIAPNNRDGNAEEQPIEHKESPYQMGANSYSSELYKEMRQAIQAGPNVSRANLPMPRYTYLVSRPPRIVLKGFLLRREKQTSLMLRGRAIHPLSVRDVMIFADKRKILYLSSAARNDAGCIEFSADIPLLSETSHILVVARHNDEVMGSQSLFVRRDQ
jgi:hypothetical protein